jgi:uncharacterized protein (DUF3820 family)
MPLWLISESDTHLGGNNKIIQLIKVIREYLFWFKEEWWSIGKIHKLLDGIP